MFIIEFKLVVFTWESSRGGDTAGVNCNRCARGNKVIANSEEQFISFSKYKSRTFTIQFEDPCRFMPSKLSSLTKNILTQDFTKFRETAIYFYDGDIPFDTRKVYPYEYLYGWLG